MAQATAEREQADPQQSHERHARRPAPLEDPGVAAHGSVPATGSTSPAGLIYALFFLVPTVVSFYSRFTRWTLFDSTFIGLDNFQQFFAEQALVIGPHATRCIYAVVTSGLKVVLGMALACC